MIMIRRRAGASSRFEPGELVRHRRYGYRGVVVSVDDSCTAPDTWYLANKTQPRRDQPWYHVLVDGARHTTYAAAENLVADYVDAPITHPMVHLFFDGFEDGRYLRNDNPWG